MQKKRCPPCADDEEPLLSEWRVLNAETQQVRVCHVSSKCLPARKRLQRA